MYTRSGFGLGRADATPGAGRHLDQTFRRILAYSGAAVLVTKRIGNIQRMQLLRDAFPEARFVRITRDGRAVALSLSKVDWWNESFLPWLGTTPKDWDGSGGDPWEVCARNWVEEVTRVEQELEKADPSNVFDLSYETLIADPIGVLTSIARFLDLTPAPDWFSEIESLEFSRRTDSWRGALEPAVIDKISRIQISVLRKYGYAP